MKITIVNPIEHAYWNQTTAVLKGHSIFHTSEWARLLMETYGYRPNYIVALCDSQIVGVLPLMEVKSLLTGNRGVMLPFTDHCLPLSDDRTALELMWAKARHCGKQKRWNYIEIHGDHEYFQSERSSALFRTHLLSLECELKLVEQRLRDSTRRNIRNATKYGVKIFHCTSMESVKIFYRLNCMTRKRHGLPPQPLRWFKNLYSIIMTVNKGFVLLAKYKNQFIAGGFFLSNSNTLLYKYGASLSGFERLRANNLLIWEAISWGKKNGFKTFDFGRTEMENRGLLQFKRGWRGEERDLRYLKYEPKSDRFLGSKSEQKTTYRMFKKMPLPLLKLSGRILYRHAG